MLPLAEDATESDLLAVYRFLLFLPPGAPAPPEPVSAGYRNSLLLVDESTRSVLAVLPLSSPAPHGSSNDCSRAPSRLPVPHPHIPPSPTYHPSASEFAHYVSHVATTLHPNPTPEALGAAERVALDTRDRLAREEMASDELQVLVPGPDFRVRPLESAEDDDNQGWRDEHRRLDKGFERLDREMGLTSPTARGAQRPVPKGPVSRHTAASRPASAWSVSSLATMGTERFVTADEGDELDGGDSTSRRSSFAPVSRANDGDAAVNEAPSASSEIQEARAPSATPPSPPPPKQLPTFDPAHTLTNGNAVLLSFLGGPSIISPTQARHDAAAGGESHRLAVLTHPLSQDQASETTLRGEIAPAETELPRFNASSDASSSERWWTWLVELFGQGEKVRGETDQPAATAEWLSWLGLPSLSSVFAPVTGGDGRRRAIPRSAAGEATSRLSVYHIDEDGRGSRAFVSRS
ncbi:hypothetical protein Rhopal_005756-T1 [Rhodotorula paludigena]|uniref:Uncharacterized protein n=1 Tax=Rhodotorula paludigena TaxID=86838 RepID=A0AAV5GJD0_9BASI|nr:hypothetical protein Rhopal_005756-T1 [Rhodotorula paludigena]